jgi:hypothetical protein
MTLRLRSIIAIMTCWCMVAMTSAAASNIGFLMTTGKVQVDGSLVQGNSTIFSGNVISAGDGISNLRFSDGTTAMMSRGAAMTVYAEHSVLQQGALMQRGVDKHAVFADGLHVSGATPNATAMVWVKDASHVQIASQQGEVNVLTESGALLARIEPGKTLTFDIRQAAANHVNGIALCGQLGGNHQIQDSLTNITYQLQGNNLDSYVGQWVQVDGTPIQTSVSSTSTAPHLVMVSAVKELDPSCDDSDPADPPHSLSPTARVIIVVSVALAIGAIIGAIAESGAKPPPRPPVTPSVP